MLPGHASVPARALPSSPARTQTPELSLLPYPSCKAPASPRWSVSHCHCRDLSPQL